MGLYFCVNNLFCTQKSYRPLVAYLTFWSIKFGVSDFTEVYLLFFVCSLYSSIGFLMLVILTASSFITNGWRVS